MSIATLTPLLTLEQFHASPEYCALTERQQKFIDSYVVSQNLTQATITAYGDGPTDRYVALMARRLQSSHRIQNALDHFYGRTERERFLRELETDIKKSSGIALVRLRELFARIAGFVPLDGESDTVDHPPVSVGDIITTSDGVNRRVLSVTEHGRPVDVSDEAVL